MPERVALICCGVVASLMLVYAGYLWHLGLIIR
jgi:hypothetical protein